MMRPAGCLALLALAVLGGCNAQPCPKPLESCGGICIDVASDRVNCGTCGTVCTTGLACANGQCIASASQACAVRKGGAFVTLGICGQAVTIWASPDAFIARAEQLALDPSAGPPDVPIFDLRDGVDCDAQWTWHVDSVTPVFADAAPSACNACPSVVEGSKAAWLGAGRWCPSPAVVLAVRRP
jgi:Stigma-specific protein, Stig1